MDQNIEYELYHHGVKGMKWGVRRFRNKKKRPMRDESKTSKQNLNKSDKVKKLTKRGAAVAGVVLAAYGGYKVNDFLNSVSYTVNGKTVSRKEFASTINAIVKILS